MKNVIVIVFVSFLNVAHSQELQLDWLVTGFHNNIYWSKKSVINESDSCLYSVGVFQSDMSMEQHDIHSNYMKSIFLLKTNRNGEVLWLKNIADLSYLVELTSRTTINVDNSGNLLLGISFNDKIYFNQDSIIFDTPNSEGVALLKLDTAANFLWSKKIYAESLGKEGLSVDHLNNIYLTGTANQDVFLSKFSETGDSLWTKTGGSAAGTDAGMVLRFDSFDNVYLLGNLQPSNGIYFDTYHPTFVSPYTSGSFVAKYSSMGQIQWVRCFYASNFGEAVSASSMGILSNGQIVIGGGFSGDKIKFYPNAPILAGNISGFNGSFLLSYSVDGELLWKISPHNNFGGSTGINRVVSNSEVDGFFTTTSFTGSVGVLSDTLSGNAEGTSFIEKYDNLGNTQWYNRYGGTNLISTLDVFIDQNNIILSGSTNSNPLYFNGTSHSLTTNPSFYIAKLHDNIVSVYEHEQQMYSLFPNPTSGNVQINSQSSLKGEKLRVYNTLGELVYQQLLNNQFSNELNLPEAPGMYFINVSGQTMKVVKE